MKQQPGLEEEEGVYKVGKMRFRNLKIIVYNRKEPEMPYKKKKKGKKK